MGTIYKILEYIIPKTLELNKSYLSDESIKINYSAIFCQDNNEYDLFNKEASQIGAVIQDTPTGPLYKFQEPIQTIAGPLWLIKIRKPDSAHPQRGDADFTLKDYYSFKEQHSKNTDHFKLIDRGNFEMIELQDPNFDVMSYFSSIPLTVQFGIE